MPYQQRDIVKVKRPLPSGGEVTHPFLIISNSRAISHESVPYYTGVMMTHSTNKDKFSLQVTKEMIDGSYHNDWSQIRLHIIASFSESDISRDITKYVGKMKKLDFTAVLNQIKDNILSVD